MNEDCIPESMPRPVVGATRNLAVKSNPNRNIGTLVEPDRTASLLARVASLEKQMEEFVSWTSQQVDILSQRTMRIESILGV